MNNFQSALNHLNKQLRYQPAKNRLHAACLATAIILSGCSSDSETESVDVSAVLDRSQAYYDKGQFKASMIEAKNVLQITPNNQLALIISARNQLRIGNYNGASDLLEELVNSGENIKVEAYLILAEAHVLRKKNKSAINVINRMPNGTAKENLQRDILMAKAYSGQNNNEEAERWFNKVIASNPKSIEALTSYAKHALFNNKLEEAKSRLQQAIEIDPTAPEVLTVKGVISSGEKDYESAVEAFTEAVSQLPTTDIITWKRATLVKLLQDTLTKQGKIAEAAIYEKVLSDANPGLSELEAKFSDARELYSAGKLEEAGELLKDLQTMAPDNSQTLMLLGLIEYSQDNLEEAEALFTKSIDPETATGEAMKLLAVSSLRLNHPQKVLDLLEDNIDRYENDPEMLSIYGIAALSMGNANTGENALLMSLNMKPERAQTRIALSKYYFREGRNEEAEKLLQKGIAITPNDIDINLSLMKLHFQNKEFTSSDKYAAKLLTISPDDANIRLIIAKQYFAQKRTKEALEQFDTAFKLDNTNTTALLGAAAVHMSEKDFEKASQVYSKAIEINPEEVNGYKGLFTVYESNKKTTEGLKKLSALAKNEKNAYASNAVLAEYHLRTKKPDEALPYAKAAHELKPNLGYAKALHTTTHYQLAQKAYAEKSHDNARQAGNKALEISPGDTKVLELMFRNELSVKQFDAATKIVGVIQKAHPESELAGLLNADLLIAQGKADEGIEAFQKIWDKKPIPNVGKRLLGLYKTNKGSDRAIEFAKSWSKLDAKAYAPKLFVALESQAKGDKALAITQYEDALDLVPNDPVALNNLAWLYFEAKNNKALFTAERAYQLAPKSSPIADTYGWILTHEGQVEKGIELLTIATNLDPSSQEIKDHLAEAKAKIR